MLAVALRQTSPSSFNPKQTSRLKALDLLVCVDLRLQNPPCPLLGVHALDRLR
jgi:hypothetical protein